MAVRWVSERFGTRGSSVLIQQDGLDAELFAEDLVTPLANPVTVSPNGFVFFAVEPGSYQLTESGKGTASRLLTVGGEIVIGIEMENGVPVLITQEV